MSLPIPNTRPLGRYVNQWLRHDGEYPGDEAVKVTIQALAQQWYSERTDGLDVLALQSLDDLAELIEAARDLI